LARTAGAEPIQLGNARTSQSRSEETSNAVWKRTFGSLRRRIEGKYDLVEQVLSDLGAEFHFTGVAIRPGRPACSRRAGEACLRAGPGNPVSTMVTFELFVLPAIDLLSGAAPRLCRFFAASLRRLSTRRVNDHFLPARIEWEGREARVMQLPWQGSGDDRCAGAG